MYKQALAALSLSLGLSLAFSSASCEPPCPGQQSCGDSNTSGAGGGGGGPATCEALTAMRSCMDTFCKTASNPFCGCYSGGRFLNTNGCTCVAFDTQKFCDQAEINGIDATNYDCGADSSAVASYCVPVN